MNDALRAALRSTIESTVGVLVLAGIFDWTPELVAGVMLVVTNALTLLQLFWKTGQGNPPPPPELTIGEPAPKVRRSRGR